MTSDNDLLLNGLVKVEEWLESTQQSLYEKWRSTTGHQPEASHRTWACEIANRCCACNEHLSLPCSLLMEANEIAGYLNTPCYTESPETFLRLYMIILSEFVNQLKDVARLIDVRVGKPPSKVIVWANRWAKHRLHFLVQHHPEFLFADSYEESWDEVAAALRASSAIDSCGREHPIMVIDYNWLCNASGKRPDLKSANDECLALVAVPPLETFLDATMAYFREFIDACLEKPELVQRFESEHFTLRC